MRVRGILHDVRDQCLTVNGQCLTVRRHCLTARRHCLTVRRQCLTVNGQCLTIKGQCLTVRGQCLNVRGQCLNVRGRCLNVRDRCLNVSGLRIQFINSPSITSQNPQSHSRRALQPPAFSTMQLKKKSQQISIPQNNSYGLPLATPTSDPLHLTPYHLYLKNHNFVYHQYKNMKHNRRKNCLMLSFGLFTTPIH